MQAHFYSARPALKNILQRLQPQKLASMPPLRDLLFAVATAAVFGITAWISIILTRHTNGIATVWVANGILLAAMLITPKPETRLLTIFLCVVTNVVASAATDRTVGVSVAFALANAAEALTAFCLIAHFSSEKPDFTRIDCLSRYAILAGGIAPLLPAIWGGFFASLLYGASFEESFGTWYIADSLGLLIVTPALILIWEQGRESMKVRTRWELVSLFAVLFVATMAIFIRGHLAAMFLVTPILLLIACRLGPAFAALSTLVMAVTALVAISVGLDPALLNSGNAMAAKIEFIQLLVCASFFTVLPLANLITAQETLRAKLASEIALRDALAADLMARKEALNIQKSQVEIERNRLRDAIDIMPQGIVMLDAEDRYVVWNKKYAEIYKETAHLMSNGASFEEATRAGLELGLYPEAVGREHEWLSERLARIKNPGEPHEQRLADGRCVLIEERRTSEGGLISIRIDITEMKQREASTRLLFESNPVPMFVVAKDTLAIRAVNRATIEHYGYTDPQFSKLSLGDIQRGAVEWASIDGKDGAVQMASAGQAVKHVHRSGRPIDVEIYRSSFIHNGVPSYLIAAIDVTQRIIAEGRAVHMARHDPLTNLPNRNLLSERMKQAIARARRGDRIALLFLDLDNFKAINDTLGHGAGDELLQEVADRLRRAVREADTVARLGGDEFAILLVGADLPHGAAIVAQRILNAVRLPVRLGTKDVVCGVSIGIALAPDDAEETAELFRCADLALYAAKEESRGTYRFFQREMDEKMRARNVLEAELETAIKDNQLEIHYQPIVAVDTNRPTCVEALVRWRHPVRGLIPPINFIPVAEETGMIVDIGEHVLRRACHDAVSWPDDISVAINISALELDSPELFATIESALADSGLAANRLQIEITESTLMRDVDRSVKILLQIGMLGIGIAMDDFGTGYSSLSSLRSFPFDKIKIDRAFVKDLESSSEARAVLTTIVDLANTLGMRTTAEGVETTTQNEIVRSTGCSEVQGYLFYKPVPQDELLALLAVLDAEVRKVA